MSNALYGRLRKRTHASVLLRSLPQQEPQRFAGLDKTVLERWQILRDALGLVIRLDVTLQVLLIQLLERVLLAIWIVSIG